jgi:hypothetical protein
LGFRELIHEKVSNDSRPNEEAPKVSVEEISNPEFAAVILALFLVVWSITQGPMTFFYTIPCLIIGSVIYFIYRGRNNLKTSEKLSSDKSQESKEVKTHCEDNSNKEFISSTHETNGDTSKIKESSFFVGQKIFVKPDVFSIEEKFTYGIKYWENHNFGETKLWIPATILDIVQKADSQELCVRTNLCDKPISLNKIQPLTDSGTIYRASIKPIRLGMDIFIGFISLILVVFIGGVLANLPALTVLLFWGALYIIYFQNFRQTKDSIHQRIEKATLNQLKEGRKRYIRGKSQNDFNFLVGVGLMTFGVFGCLPGPLFPVLGVIGGISVFIAIILFLNPSKDEVQEIREQKKIKKTLDKLYEETGADLIALGLNGQIFIYENKVVITRHGAVSFMIVKGITGEKTIPMVSITSVQFSRIGYIQFSVKGSLEANKGASEALFDENSITFDPNDQEMVSSFLKAKDYIEEKITSTETKITNSGESDVLNKLERLSELYGKGHLTREEFEDQKKKLLG